MTPQVPDLQAGPSTSAAGAMATTDPSQAVWFSEPWMPSTAAGDLTIEDLVQAWSTSQLLGTNSALIEVPTHCPTDTSTALAELRRLSGLTWEQLAQIFGVSRRTLHFWASGKSLNARNEEHLWRLLDVLRKVDRGAADVNRAILLTDRDGTIPIKLLEERRYDEFLQRVGEGPGRRSVARKPLSREAREARKPQPPEDLVDARQDRVHKDVGGGRAARTVRSKRRGPEQG